MAIGKLDESDTARDRTKKSKTSATFAMTDEWEQSLEFSGGLRHSDGIKHIEAFITSLMILKPTEHCEILLTNSVKATSDESYTTSDGGLCVRSVSC